MNKLLLLAKTIIKDGKMNEEQVLKHYSDAICDSLNLKDEYRYLYEDAYGHVITKELAESWVKSMAITDGSDRLNGMKWTVDQTCEYGNKVGIDWNEVSKTDFYIAMNMAYSDYYRTAKKYGHETDPVFFADIAKDFICDEDSAENRLYNYYFEVII